MRDGELVEIHFGEERIKHVFCAYEGVTFLTNQNVYVSPKNLTLVKKDPYTDPNRIKFIGNHLTANYTIVMDNDEIYCRSNDNCYTNKDITPPLDEGETIIALVTGYAHSIIVRLFLY
jgi:hypothetical protein